MCRTYTTLVLSGKGRSRLQQVRAFRRRMVQATVRPRTTELHKSGQLAAEKGQRPISCSLFCHASWSRPNNPTGWLCMRMRVMHCLAMRRPPTIMRSSAIAYKGQALQVIDWVGGPTWDGCLIFDGVPPVLCRCQQ